MRILAALAAGLLLLIGQAAAQTGAPPNAELLPQGVGRDATLRVCTACHAPEVIVNRVQKTVPWSDVVQAMVEMGAEATPAEAAEITAYLKKTLPEAAARNPKTQSSSPCPQTFLHPSTS